MLTREYVLNKMKEVFPKWMDIRKRVNKSKGGLLLGSIADETLKVQDAIKEFKQTFFIDNYFGKEEDVIAFLYKSHIGEIELSQIQCLVPELMITTSINEFYSSNNYCYYDKGFLYFKQKHIEENKLINKDDIKIKYAVNNYSVFAKAEKYHVWNVFDEFATFVGLKRHMWEDNKSLEERILRVNEHIVNSTELGLKNAILNELCAVEPDLTEEDIKIEAPCPENLLKYYNEFETVIDKLARVNKDVYKTKQWDIDSWSHDINSVDYIPHVWDTYIKNYKNGIGFKDDLKIVQAKKGDGTTLKVSFYKERLKNIKQFIKNSNPQTHIELRLKKYNNNLASNKAIYKITASTAKEISKAPIIITSSIKSTKTENYLIEDILENTEDSMKDIEVIDDSILKDDEDYYLEITPKCDYEYFNLSKCNAVYIGKNNEEVSLLKENENFKFNEEHELVNIKTKACVKTVEDLNAYTNLKDSPNGIVVDNISKEGIATLHAEKFKNQKIYIQHKCELSNLNANVVHMQNFDLVDNVFVAHKTEDKRSIKFEGNYNEISFTLNGSFIVKSTVDGETNTIINSGVLNFSTNKNFLEPKPMAFEIICTGNNLEVSNMKCSKFKIEVYLGDTKVQDIIPSSLSNTLDIKISTKLGFAPIIEKIYIGHSLKEEKYITEIISNKEGEKRKIVVRGDVKIKLVDKNGAKKDFEPVTKYKAISDSAYVKLDLKDFSNIDIAYCDNKLRKVQNDYYIFLKSGEEINKIKIYGTLQKVISKLSLEKLLNAKTSEGHKIYVSSLIEGFVVQRDDTQELHHLNRDTLGIPRSSKVEISNIPDDMVAKFFVDKATHKATICNSYSGSFDEIVIVPKNSKEYIAYNEKNIYSKLTNNIEIVNTFSPLLPNNNELLAYLVEPISKNIKVSFQENKNFSLLKPWTIGRKSLSIESFKTLSNTEEYTKDIVNIKEQFALSDVIKLSPKYQANGQLIDLTEYMIETNDNNKVIYRGRTKTIPLVDSINAEPEFYYVEKIVCENDMFNKLKHSNIDDILYIGTGEWKDTNSVSNISSKQYQLLNDEGIIIWNDPKLIGNTVHIFYSIKIPDYIKVDINELYKNINYNINAYELVGEKEYYSLNHNDIVDLSHNYLFKNSTRVLLECKNPGFNATINNGIVRVRFVAKENELAVKTGFYYDNGDEYYLFNNQDKFLNKIVDNDYLNYHNVRKENGEMIFNKGSKNYISNSVMTKDYMFESYYNNLQKQKTIKGISKLNSLTACDNFNAWTTTGCTLKLVNGINDVGILFEQDFDRDGYAFINITEYLTDTNFISLYCDGPEVYIGKEIKFEGLSFNKDDSITTIKKLLNPYNDNFKEAVFKKEPGYNYYLIVTGSGIIDDIIVSDTSIDRAEIHEKNIDKLGLKINEKDSGNYIRKIFIDNNKGCKCLGAELDKDKKIVNSSHLEWGLTSIKEIKSKEDYQKCEMERLDITNNLIVSREKGKIVTDPIPIENMESVKNLVVKINNIYFNSMRGFNVIVYGSNKMYGRYSPILKSNNNIFSLTKNKLMPYIRIAIALPKDKIIESISVYAQYNTSSGHAPRTNYYNNGELLTKVLDTQSSLNYRVSDISIASISNINDIEVFIRGARENEDNQWMSWKKVELTSDLKINNEIQFKNCRYFQAKIRLKTKSAYIKINNIDLEVI